MQPHITELHAGQGAKVLERRIMPQMAHFVAPVFEELCREWLRHRSLTGEIGFRPDAIGRWWTRDQEIDLVAFDRQDALFGECKWSSAPVGPAVLRDLQSKATRVLELADRRARYALFSRSGFRGLEPGPDLLLVDLPAVVEDRMPRHPRA